MIGLAVLAGFLVVIIVILAYLLGFQMGSEHPQPPLEGIRVEAADAARHIDDLTRAAVAAMTDYATGRQRTDD